MFPIYFWLLSIIILYQISIIYEWLQWSPNILKIMPLLINGNINVIYNYRETNLYDRSFLNYNKKTKLILLKSRVVFRENTNIFQLLFIYFPIIEKSSGNFLRMSLEVIPTGSNVLPETTLSDEDWRKFTDLKPSIIMYQCIWALIDIL